MELFSINWITVIHSNHVCYILLNVHITIAINFEGSTRQTLSRLSAGTHNIEIKFIPTNSPDLFTLKTHQFNVEPMCKLSIQFVCIVYHSWQSLGN